MPQRLNTVIAFDTWQRDEADERPLNPTLEKLVTDTHGAALLTAVVTSAVNALREPGVHRSRMDLEMYLPSANGMTMSLRVLGREAGLSMRGYAGVSAFYTALEPALREIDRYFADIGLMGIERAAAVHQFSLASTWRLVCRTACDAVDELNLETEDRLPELYFLNAGVLGRLLAAASRGESPCVDPEGKPFLPPLPQRRRSARRMLGQAGRITFAGRTRRCYVRDVSQGGLGLEQAGRLPVDQAASVELATGRRFSGTIVWSKDNRAGIRFTVPLTPNDPLLWA